MVDVVIVGAGPLGLAHAWAMKKLNPELSIVIYEKYTEYQRRHTLSMQWQHLASLMKATGTEEHPTLKPLLARLKKDPHIRTNELEKIFKELALECEEGCEPTRIIHEAITPENIEEKILEGHPEAKLILGADGTHSVVSKHFFGEDNQVKQEFDYVLQLRYEVNGSHKDEAVATANFYQNMARGGMIASEYVGHFAKGQTPVTMQMMISKEVFDRLKSIATSQKPIHLKNNEQAKDIPQDIRSFLTRYLELKIEKCHEDSSLIDWNSVRVSVNEAPATYARQISRQVARKDGSKVHVKLAGDAKLGLSYFKGLNAGNEATAIFIEQMKEHIRNGFADEEQLELSLNQYQTWFTEVYAPKKVHEVSQYSRRNIRAPMRIMEAVQKVKGISWQDDIDSSEELLNAYFNLQQAPAHQVSREKQWRKYPHRSYDPVGLGDWKYIPITHHLKKTVKLFTDFFKPYKTSASWHPFKQDLRQPLVGLLNVGSGLLKTLVGLLSLNPWRFLDGVFSLVRGAIEIATTPLTWLLKPITRGIATLIYKGFWGPKKIEDNTGMRKLAKLGIKAVDEFDQESLDHDPSAQSSYNIIALCHDMHRKYMKGIRHQQITDVAMDELAAYKQVVDEPVADPTTARQYFSLFYNKPENKADKVEAPSHQEGLSI
ncbi:hypothetical protein B1207_13475 [Legionella quinlivanii]|uniref:Uncharacterized protein n=1 Tax=Legionella quinlivanii TaxID=45073 RepID=A0A364LG53_9GAMM|nr:hypothetical protein [Legionella quinlivanii]RAP35113.1 hypothetical protein B1207_13475 [Legionella quinlivanii]